MEVKLKANKVELKERSWRADPSDGFRPLKYVRKIFKKIKYE